MSKLLKRNVLLLAVMATILYAIPAWASVSCTECDTNMSACSNVLNQYMNNCTNYCSANNPTSACYLACFDTGESMQNFCNEQYLSCYATCTP